jgi:phage terminase Nu1 subunit (DNA packaging protein)
MFVVNKRTAAASEARKDALAKFEGDTLLLSTKAMCAVLGVTAETLSKWVKQGCPKHATGWWEPKQVIEWRHGNGKKGDAEQRKLEADIRYREAKAEMEEIKKLELTGQYVSVDDIEKSLSEVFTRIKQGLIFMGHRITTELNAQFPELALDAKRLVDEEVAKALGQLAETGRYKPGNKRKTNTKPSN